MICGRSRRGTAPGAQRTASSCGLCRDEARTSGSLDLYGAEVTDVLGGVDNAHTALALAEGSQTPSDDQVDVARTLLHAERLRSQLPGRVA